MKRITVAAACALAALAAGAALAASCYANEPNWGGGLLTASFPSSQFRNSATTVPTTISPLVAKELAVLTNKGISPTRAIQALDVQSKVAEAKLLSKLQAVMAGNFGGAWFENDLAQLYVGTTSSAGRRAAETLVAQAGLAGVVTVVPVRSTIAELVALQGRWNDKLADIMALGAAQTGIDPKRNAVAVKLASGVDATRRATLESEAATAEANVLVTIVEGPTLGITDLAGECNNFAANKARCNPSITAGVTIERPLATTGSGTGKSHSNDTLDGFSAPTLAGVLPGDAVDGTGVLTGTIVIEKPTTTSVLLNKIVDNAAEGSFTFLTGAICTAGPAAIPTATKANRVLLTAGHCIEGGHGVGESWSAYNRAGTKSVIGKALQFSNGTTGVDLLGDFGDIAIEPGGGWQTGLPNNPVLAVTAEWKRLEETRYRVKAEKVPAGGTMDCHEGQTSGEECGVVGTLNVSITTTGNGKAKEGLVEDSAPGEPGDSGGPYIFVATTGNPNREAEVEGTLSAGNLTVTYFEPLKQPVGGGAAKGSLEVLGLELLTTANEVSTSARWDVNGLTLAGAEPLLSSATVLSNPELEAAGVKVTCKGTTIGITGGELVAPNEIQAKDLKFTGCSSPAPCTLAGETILTLPLQGTATLDGTLNTFISVSP
ncbi:MAG TPA: hypothetical protein VGI76_06440, partial [Solirubrobacteraceae bacterium]